MTKKSFILPLAISIILAGCQSGGGNQYDSGASDSAFAISGSNQAVMAETMEVTMAAAQETMAPAYDCEMEEGAQDSAWKLETAASAGARGLTSSQGVSPTPSPARKLIRNVYMNVETDAFDGLVNQLYAKVTELAGYVEQSDISGSSITRGNLRPDRYASMTARIPSSNLDQFIAVVEGSGNVTNKSESTQDVTLQYSDLESRKKTLTVEQERIWSLLEKADTLEAVIALEERLSEIRYELESMESRLKLFDNQVEYSTIDISIREVLPADFTPVAPETAAQRIKKGFVKNAENVSQTLTDLFIGIIAGIPVWLPLACLLLLILALAGRRGKRKSISLFKKRKKDAAPPASPDGLSSKTDSPKE